MVLAGDCRYSLRLRGMDVLRDVQFTKMIGKEAREMCEHKRLRSVGDRIFCCECGQEVGIDFLMAQNEQKQVKNPSEEAPEKKAPAKKRAAKKAV